jgi:RNA polymerase sigma-70 factor (ECF subfamily)
MAELNQEPLEELVEKARTGDRKAFSAIVRRMMNQVTALTYRMTGDRDTALDLAQETFVSAWQNLGSFRGEAGFASWVYRIATNKSLNLLKAAQRLTSLPEEGEFQPELAVSEDPHSEMHRGELAEQVAKFTLTLPPQQRAVFELRFYKQMTFEEISRTTGKALGTVKTNYREAVKKLRTYATAKGLRS